MTTMKTDGLTCADIRDHGGHSDPCRCPDCTAPAGACCDHCYWVMA